MMTEKGQGGSERDLRSQTAEFEDKGGDREPRHMGGL